MLAVMRFAVGQLGAAEMLTAVFGKDPANDSERACAAHFYLGAKCQLAGDQPGAVGHFKACVATWRQDCSEWRSVQAELARLAQLRK
jgi:lipoprotein NlpI